MASQNLKEVEDMRQEQNKLSFLASIADFSLLPFISFYGQEAFANRKDGVILCCVKNPFYLTSKVMHMMGKICFFLIDKMLHMNSFAKQTDVANVQLL